MKNVAQKWPGFLYLFEFQIVLPVLKNIPGVIIFKVFFFGKNCELLPFLHFSLEFLCKFEKQLWKTNRGRNLIMFAL